MKQKGGEKKSKKLIVAIILILVVAAAGVGGWWWFSHQDEADGGDAILGGSQPEPLRNALTGLVVSENNPKSALTYCVQIPNGSTDGARPQVGLTHAGVVFEAITETGITRFAAIFDGGVDTGVIGPIRSLRPYYLDWDTPFGCTVVHDGGSHEALAAVGNGNYRNLDEDFRYMWKETYIQGQYRYWNNVFTSPTKLLEFNESRGETSSNVKVFPRLTETQVAEILDSQRALCDDEESEACESIESHVQVTHIHTVFTNIVDYMVDYNYDPATNTYLRSYGNGDAHMSYDCPVGTGEGNMNNCTLTQVAPSAVAIMRVRESTMADNYHEQIQTIGSGEAYIFQNGTIVEGTWEKSSQASQIVFRDTTGAEISFTPGQLWIAAIPQFGRISWE